MKHNDFENKLTELMDQLDGLPEEQREKLNKLADETRNRHDRIRKTMSSLQESLDYLRLSVKYLVFDLEATKRENNHLRNLLRNVAGDENTDNNPDADPSPGN